MLSSWNMFALYRVRTRLLPRGGHGHAEEFGAVNSGPNEAGGTGIVDETVDDSQALRIGLRDTQLSGNRLTLTSDPRPSGRDPSKTVVTRLVWEKIE
jgi:hypothetical protein